MHTPEGGAFQVKGAAGADFLTLVHSEVARGEGIRKE